MNKFTNDILCLDDDKLLITGRGNFGQQGRGDKNDQKGFTSLDMLKGLKIKGISAASESNHIVTGNSSAFSNKFLGINKIINDYR